MPPPPMHLYHLAPLCAESGGGECSFSFEQRQVAPSPAAVAGDLDIAAAKEAARRTKRDVDVERERSIDSGAPPEQFPVLRRAEVGAKLRCGRVGGVARSRLVVFGDQGAVEANRLPEIVHIDSNPSVFPSSEHPPRREEPAQIRRPNGWGGDGVYDTNHVLMEGYRRVDEWAECPSERLVPTTETDLPTVEARNLTAEFASPGERSVFLGAEFPWLAQTTPCLTAEFGFLTPQPALRPAKPWADRRE